MNKTAKGTLLVWALLLTLAVAPLSAHAQETIVITGQLKNGTAEAEVPQGVTVTLEVYSRGQVQETKETVADAEGRFTFEEVPGGEVGYVINAEYAGATYSYESDYPLPAEPVELMVYESTSSMEAIKVRLHTLVVDAASSDTGLMSTRELVWLENTGDRTFVPDIAPGGSMDVLRFSLPSTARDLEVQTSTLWRGQVLRVDVGFGLTAPVPPGSHEIDYTYFSSYTDGKLTFAHSFPFGADTFRVFLMDGLGQVTGTGLQEMEPLAVGTIRYQQLEGSNLGDGVKVTLDFSDLPEPSLWEQWQDSVPGGKLTIGAVPVAFGVLALLAYLLLRKRRPSRTTAQVLTEPEEALSLTEALARLDDRFQQGELSEREYLQRRRALRDRLLGSGESGSPGH